MAEKSTFENYLKLTEEGKAEFDANYAEEFSKYFLDFYETLDDSSKESFRNYIEENSTELNLESIKSNILNSDFISNTLAEILKKNSGYFDEGEESSAFLDALYTISRYNEDKEGFLNFEDFVNRIIKTIKETQENVVINDSMPDNFSSLLKDLKNNGISRSFSDNFSLYGLKEALNPKVVTNLLKIEDITIPEFEQEESNFPTPLNEENRIHSYEYEYSSQHSRIIENDILSHLMSTLPDFADNLFTFGFISQNTNKSFGEIAKDINIYENDESFKENKPLSTVEMFYERNIDGFYTRVSGFNIPMPKAKTIQYKFFTRTITKTGNGIEQPHTLEVEFDVDQNGYLINIFERMAGFHNSSPGSDENRTVGLGEIQQAFVPGGFLNKGNRLGILIKYNDLRYNLQSGARHGMFATDLIKSPHRDYGETGTINTFIQDELGFRAFYLDNVQFLGFTNPINFERDSANVIKLTAKFRFEKLYSI